MSIYYMCQTLFQLLSSYSSIQNKKIPVLMGLYFNGEKQIIIETNMDSI